MTLITLIIVLAILAAIYLVVQHLGLPEPFASIAKILILVVLLILLLNMLGVGGTWLSPRAQVIGGILA